MSGEFVVDYSVLRGSLPGVETTAIVCFNGLRRQATIFE